MDFQTDPNGSKTVKGTMATINPQHWRLRLPHSERKRGNTVTEIQKTEADIH